MLVYNRDYQIWVGQRLGGKTWQLPQGGVKKKYSIEENVRREIREELGVSFRHLGQLTQLEATHQYEWKDRVPKRWAGKYCGQSQTFWAVEFLGKDKDIHVSADEHPEFSDWRWCRPEEVLDRVEPLRRAGYLLPLREFVEKIRPAS